MSKPRCKQVTEQHNSFGNYYFLYKNSTGSWNTATNPVFIAFHQHCRAIPKEIVNDIGYPLSCDFVYALNSHQISADKLNILAVFDIN